MENMDLLFSLLESNTVGVLEGQFRSNASFFHFQDKVSNDTEHPDKEIIFSTTTSGLVGILKFPEAGPMAIKSILQEQVLIRMDRYTIEIQTRAESSTGTFYAYLTDYNEVKNRIKERKKNN